MVAHRLLPLLLLTVPAAVSAETNAVAQFNCDALTVSQKLDSRVARALEPAHSLQAAEAVLTQHNVPFARSQGMMTMSGVPQKVVDRIYTLPQGEPIILPNGNGVAICVPRPSADSY
jgi:phosphohistidine swiveling domain-containing protein